MPSHRPVRARSASVAAAVALSLLLAAGTGTATARPATARPAAAPAVAAAPAPAAKPKPKPVVLPTASSWVGGKQLIGTGVLADLPAGVPAPPAPKAASWLVADLGSRSILAGRRVHVPLAPASTLKIFTALALAPELDPKKVYRGRDDDAAIDGTKVGIVPGSSYTVDDLLHGLMMSSGNDCANALANLVGGRGRATELMMDVATHLGAFDTVARNTSGLDAKGQVSSAYDLALAGSAALDDERLAKVMATTSYRFPGQGRTLGKARGRFETQNHNRLLRNYPGALGVKNGYTVAARGSFVGAAERGGRTYLAVVMRAEGSTWRQSADLLDWAFAHGRKAAPVGTLVRPGELPAKTGPAVGDDGAVLGVATTPASPTPTSTTATTATPATAAGTDGTGDDLAGAALPATGTTAARPALGTTAGRAALATAGLGLVALAWFAGRRLRPGSARAGGPAAGRGGPEGPGGRRGRTGSRVRLPGAGRHRN